MGFCEELRQAQQTCVLLEEKNYWAALELRWYSAWLVRPVRWPHEPRMQLQSVTGMQSDSLYRTAHIQSSGRHYQSAKTKTKIVTGASRSSSRVLLDLLP